MIAVIDYGVGNLFSLACSLRHLGLPSRVTNVPEEIRAAERIILPGVGAFGDAMDKLTATGLVPVLDAEVAAGKPLMGICLGMQLLFESSREYGAHRGLGYLKGEICPLDADVQGLKIPQMGWNSLSLLRPGDPLAKYTRAGDYVYYVHSFYAKGCEESLVAVSHYGVLVPGMVHLGNVYGTQFHPEKSGEAGLNILRAFSEAPAQSGPEMPV